MARVSPSPPHTHRETCDGDQGGGGGGEAEVADSPARRHSGRGEKRRGRAGTVERIDYHGNDGAPNDFYLHGPHSRREHLMTTAKQLPPTRSMTGRRLAAERHGTHTLSKSRGPW
ncbi:unnamed protein product [Blumeria hordei]|uniref:Uncharacterized protein n=1 Tax=Blumeria hordei TaxID=2867405 RepID=A0A383UYT6_BLUHO|nr:unnamed protein product [Blumeria hordei]